MDKKSGVGLLVARVGIGTIFLASGLGKLAAWSGTAAFAGSRGVPEVLLAVATALELAGGLSLLLGWKTRLGALALLAFLAPVTLVFHAFWAMPAAEARPEMIQFLKNLSIAGGVIAIFAAGPGRLSLDALRDRGRAHGGVPARAAA